MLWHYVPAKCRKLHIPHIHIISCTGTLPRKIGPLITHRLFALFARKFQDEQRAGYLKCHGITGRMQDVLRIILITIGTQDVTVEKNIQITDL